MNIVYVILPIIGALAGSIIGDRAYKKYNNRKKK